MIEAPLIRQVRALRLVVLVMACLTAACLPVFVPSAARAQVGFDRRGDDYANFPVRSGDPAVCAAHCDRDSRCKAFSFSYPTRDHQAECWLKNEVPPRVEDTGAASGVRGAGVIEPRQRYREFSTDRPGGDYRNFEVAATPNGDACKAACEADSECRAWTYVRPGYGGPEPRCWLKNHLTPPRHRPCCISGVVR